MIANLPEHGWSGDEGDPELDAKAGGCVEHDLSPEDGFGDQGLEDADGGSDEAGSDEQILLAKLEPHLKKITRNRTFLEVTIEVYNQTIKLIT